MAFHIISTKISENKDKKFSSKTSFVKKFENENSDETEPPTPIDDNSNSTLDFCKIKFINL